MKKRSKIGWTGLFIATAAFIVGKAYLDANFFDGLNPFHKKDAAQAEAPAAVMPQNVSEFEGSTKTLQEQVDEMKAKERSLKEDLTDDQEAPQP